MWYKNIDVGKLNGIVFLDLKKAFDTVDHNILLEKIAIYEIKELHTAGWVVFIK